MRINNLFALALVATIVTFSVGCNAVKKTEVAEDGPTDTVVTTVQEDGTVTDKVMAPASREVFLDGFKAGYEQGRRERTPEEKSAAIEAADKAVIATATILDGFKAAANELAK